MMAKSGKIKKALNIYKSFGKKQVYNTTINVIKQFGLKGLKVAVSNKLNNRPLLTGLQNDIYSDYTNYDEIGERIFLNQQSEYSYNEILEMIDEFEERPLISIVMPLYEPQIKWLIKAIESIQNQYYTNWELCIVDDGSRDKRGTELVKKFAEDDKRIKIVRNEENEGISSASNCSLSICNGEYIALMDQDDEITKDALFWIAKTINDDNSADFIYTDECKIGATNDYNRNDFFFKPDWSPSLLVNCMYIGHLTVYKTKLVKKIGGFRSKFDFSQDYDLALRASEVAKKIVHVERVLYYWRTLPTSGSAGGKDYARISNMAALKDWYKRNNLNVVMEKRDRTNYGRIIMESQPKVSIIIPTDSIENLRMSIQGLLTKTSYTNIEIIPVTNSKVAEDIQSEYPYLDSLEVCKYDKIYNFSDKCNEGAKVAKGDILIFYNDDVIPFSVDWIEKLIEILEYEKVGGVSPLLLHEDNTIQYAGLITGTPGMIGTSFNGRHYQNPIHNPYNHLMLRDVSILCGAVTVMKKDVFWEVEGFDSINTPNGHSDLDLSLKLIDAGYRCVYTPYSVLTHVGNHTWAEKNKVDKSDIYCLKKWGKYLERDMYFTDSMKEMFYHDFGYKHKIYMPDSNNWLSDKKGKDILFISHELTRTGAPVVLKDMIQAVLDNGDFAVVICPNDGPLKEELLDMGAVVIIDESFIHNHWIFEHFARNFDLVVVNTLACSQAIQLLENSLPPILWWIHEGTFAINCLRGIIPTKISDRVKTYCVGNYALSKFKKLHLTNNVQILNYGVKDVANEFIQKSENEKTSFLMIGTFEKRKGQDILVEAIKCLEDKYYDSTEYIFVGNVLEDSIYEKVKSLSDKYKNVTVIPSLKREEIFKLYNEVTCVLSPSRDDPMPVVMTEAMMMSKICVCSDCTGTADYIENQQNGFVFESENVEQLVERMEYIINNPNKLSDIGKRSRNIYEDNFSLDNFKENVLEIIKEIINEDK